MKVKVFVICYDISIFSVFKDFIKKNFISRKSIQFEIEFVLCRRIFLGCIDILDSMEFKYFFYDDIYFDYSAYQDALIKHKEDDSDGVIFINDTFISKHHSFILFKSFVEKICLVSKVVDDIPIMIGPYENSQFSFSEQCLVEYVPTYLFFLNRSSFVNVLNIIKNKDVIYENFTRKRYEKFENDIWISLLFYKSYLYERSIDESYINKKLTTCYLEKMINLFFYKKGVIFFATKSQRRLMLIDIEVKIKKAISKLKKYVLTQRFLHRPPESE